MENFPPPLPQPAAVRSAGIDLLRAVAIFLVLGCHVVVEPDEAGAWTPLAESWHRIGWAGVDLFFVLSGFLVSGLLLAEFQRRGRVDVPRFLTRRGLKIWPMYFVYLLFLTAWLTQKNPVGFAGAVDELWPNWLHVQNYVGSPRIHTWSLAVEEHFYLLNALIAGACFTTAHVVAVRRWFLPTTVVALVALAAIRYVGFVVGGREALNLFATHLRFDGLLAGTMLAYLARFEPATLAGLRRHPVKTILTGVVLAAPIMILTPDGSAWAAGPGLSVMYVGLALVVFGVVALEQGNRTGVFSNAPVQLFAQVGVFSYGIYLWHVDLAQTPMKKIAAALVTRGWSDSAVWLCATSVYVLVAIVTGMLLSRLIEIPVLALRDRWWPRAGEVPKKSLQPAVPLWRRVAGSFRSRC